LLHLFSAAAEQKLESRSEAIGALIQRGLEEFATRRQWDPVASVLSLTDKSARTCQSAPMRKIERISISAT